MPVVMGILGEPCGTGCCIPPSNKPTHIGDDRRRGEFRLACGPPCKAVTCFHRTMPKAYSVPTDALDRGGANFEGPARFPIEGSEHERAMAAIQGKYWMFRPIMEFGRIFSAIGVVCDVRADARGLTGAVKPYAELSHCAKHTVMSRIGAENLDGLVSLLFSLREAPDEEEDEEEEEDGNRKKRDEDNDEDDDGYLVRHVA